MNRFTPWSAAVLALALAVRADAIELHWDQMCMPEVMSSYSVPAFSPIGQEFVPGYTQVNVVDLWLSTSLSNDSTQVQVRLRHDTVDGPVVGTSGVVTIRQSMDGVVRFEFTPPAPTVPNERHVIEVVHVSGSANTLLGGGDGLPYAPGRSLLSGQFLWGGDFWFRTGVDRLVPTRATTWGAVKAGTP